MLTFLTIDKAKSKLLPLRNKIYAETKASGAVEAKYIHCTYNRGKVPYDKIKKMSGPDSQRLLTKEDLVLPQSSGLRRFSSCELSQRLCLNMAIKILKELKAQSDKISVGVFDPEGAIADGAGAMLRYTKSLSVVSRLTDVYSAEAERIMFESGAVLSVSKRMKTLEKAKLVISPVKLKVQLPLSKDAVILTAERPAVLQRCAVYYRYYFALDEELKVLCPSGFDSEYVASALYTLLGRFDLGSLVPQATKGDSGSHTLVSLSKYLINISSNP